MATCITCWPWRASHHLLEPPHPHLENGTLTPSDPCLKAAQNTVVIQYMLLGLYEPFLYMCILFTFLNLSFLIWKWGWLGHPQGRWHRVGTLIMSLFNYQCWFSWWHFKTEITLQFHFIHKKRKVLYKDFYNSTYHYNYYFLMFWTQTESVYTYSLFLFFNNSTLEFKALSILISNQQSIETSEKSVEKPLIRGSVRTRHGGYPFRSVYCPLGLLPAHESNPCQCGFSCFLHKK